MIQNNAHNNAFDIKPLLPVVGALFIYILGLGILIPALPFMVHASGGSEFQTVAIFAVFSACSFITAPIWGYLCDLIGRKHVIIISAFGTLVGYVWLGFSSSVTEIYLARALAGLSAGWTIATQAMVSDLCKAEHRTRAMGLLGAAFGVGFTIGPLLTALILADFITIPNIGPAGLGLTAFCAAFFTFIAILVTILKIQETKTNQNPVNKKSLLALICNRKLHSFWGIYGCVLILFTAIEASYALWCLDVFGYGPMEVGFLLGAAGLMSAVVQGGLISRLKIKFGEYRLIAIALILLIIGVLAMAYTIILMKVLLFIPPIWFALLPILIFACAISLHNPCVQSLISQIAPQSLKASALSGAQSFASLARIIGPICAGFFYQQAGNSNLYLFMLILLVPAISIWWYNRNLYCDHIQT